jgi:uncharacterized protein
MKNEVPMLKYTCPKCGSKDYSISEMRIHASVFSLMSNFGYKVMTAVSCSRCHFTELYRYPKRKIADAFIFQTGK